MLSFEFNDGRCFSSLRLAGSIDDSYHPWHGMEGIRDVSGMGTEKDLVGIRAFKRQPSP